MLFPGLSTDSRGSVTHTLMKASNVLSGSLLFEQNKEEKKAAEGKKTKEKKKNKKNGKETSDDESSEDEELKEDPASTWISHPSSTTRHQPRPF